MGFMAPDPPKDTAAADEAKREANIKTGMESIDRTFSGFTPEFYQQRAADYSGYAMPEVEQQFQDARKNLIYALARQYGTTQTSEAATRQARLAQAYAKAKADVVSKGQDYATQAQGDVEKERSALVSQLNATADPGAAAS